MVEGTTDNVYNLSSRSSPVVEKVSGSDGHMVWGVAQVHSWVMEVVVKYSCSLSFFAYLQPHCDMVSSAPSYRKSLCL